MARNPFDLVNLHGQGCFRSVTLALPVPAVRRLLPATLDLGVQGVTPEGTHPVVLSFNALYRAEMSVPTLLPSLTYHEFTLGVPFSVTRPGALGRLLGRSSPALGAARGPYYYMPRLYLDSVLATVGGVLYWGYTKRLARFKDNPGRFAIDGEDGAPLLSLDWQAEGEPRPLADFPLFEPVRGMLAQPLVSQLPLSLGPATVIADFDKHWAAATLRPLRTMVTVHREIVPGFGAARYPAEGCDPGIAASVLGSYELNAEWLLGMPHLPVFGRR